MEVIILACEHMGYKVLRFTNEEVLFDTERVINIIKNNF